MKYYIYKNNELLNVSKAKYEAWMDAGAYLQLYPEWSHKNNGISYKMEVRFDGRCEPGKEFKPFILFLFRNNFGLDIGDNGALASTFSVYYFESLDKLSEKFLAIIGELAPD
jgi:hypothetical protein